MPVEVRAVGPADAALFAHIDAGVFDGPIVPERLAAYLADPGHVMLLAIAGGRVVGQISGIVHRHPDLADEMYLDNLGVAPGWQRRGVATRLIDGLTTIARKRGCTEMWVATRAANAGAIALYAHRGDGAPVSYHYWHLD